MSATGSDAGMTLLEVLVVMGLMSLIAMVEFPQIEGALGLLQLKETTGALVANLRVVRSDAVRSTQTIAFSVAPDGRSYEWSEGETRRLPGNIAMRMTKGQTITFYGDGTSTGGEISATSGGRQISVAIDQATGAVAIER